MFTNPQAPVSLLDMLNHREHRAALQNDLLNRFGKPIISFTLNMPGPIKVSNDTSIAFTAGTQAIKDILQTHSLPILEAQEIHTHCGDELLLSIDAPSKFLKKLMMEIEEHHPYGRIFDIDVLNEKGEKESRSVYRTCLLCPKQAQECARNRTHTVEELQEAVLTIIHTHKKS